MSVRIKGRDEHNRVALTVIYFLGGIAVLATGWSGWLIHEAVVSDNAIDSAAVALVGQMVSIATLALGALGAMLSSTSPKPPPPPQLADGSVPVTAVNGDDQPVPTQPQAAEPTPDVVEELPVEDTDTPDVDQAPPARRRR